MNATSAQDEFARWAKLQRQHDKLKDQLEKKKKALSDSRAKFDTSLTAIRLLLTRGLQYFLPFWYSREALFWLPHGWFPYYAEWLLSFPRAPLGSVSITSWQVACTGVIVVWSDMLVALLGLAAGSRQKQKVPVEATEKGPEEKAESAAAGSKKEL